MHLRLTLVLAVMAAMAGCAARQHSMTGAMATGPARDERVAALVEARCTTCHGLDKIYGAEGTLDEWMALVHRMAYHHKAKLITHLSDGEAMEIAHWLAERQQPEHNRVRIGFVPTGRPL
jgi:hypothetical protein